MYVHVGPLAQSVERRADNAKVESSRLSWTTVFSFLSFFSFCPSSFFIILTSRPFSYCFPFLFLAIRLFFCRPFTYLLFSSILSIFKLSSHTRDLGGVKPAITFTDNGALGL